MSDPVRNITDLDAPQTTSAGRPLFWHVFGGAVQGKKGGKNNYALFTAGPVTEPATPRVTDTTIPGTDGEVFRYLASFDHDPSTDEKTQLKPQEYR